MVIKINGKDQEVANNAVVAELEAVKSLPLKGVALAVNQRMVPRDNWKETVLKDGDTVVIISAACGG